MGQVDDADLHAGTGPVEGQVGVEALRDRALVADAGGARGGGGHPVGHPLRAEAAQRGVVEHRGVAHLQAGDAAPGELQVPVAGELLLGGGGGVVADDAVDHSLGERRPALAGVLGADQRPAVADEGKVAEREPRRRRICGNGCRMTIWPIWC